MAVQGVERVRARIRAFRDRTVRDELRAAIETEAANLVAVMDALKPLPSIELGWTWGDAPSGSVAIDRVRGGGPEDLTVTIYATARTTDYPDGFPAIARWFEFGTATRVQTTTGRVVGRVPAQPYFFPVYRANRQRIRARLTRALTRAAKRF